MILPETPHAIATIHFVRKQTSKKMIYLKQPQFIKIKDTENQEGV